MAVFDSRYLAGISFSARPNLGRGFCIMARRSHNRKSKAALAAHYAAKNPNTKPSQLDKLRTSKREPVGNWKAPNQLVSKSFAVIPVKPKARKAKFFDKARHAEGLKFNRTAL